MSVARLSTLSPPELPAAQRVIISGGPGTGKTTLINALAAAGETCLPEVSRELIRAELTCGGRRLPWDDLIGFAAECAIRMQAQLASAPARRVFFDRGLPDVIAYLRHGGHQPSPDLAAYSKAYYSVVFLAPSWREIFTNDAERPQTFAESAALGREIIRTYQACGFSIQSLPRGSVRERVDFVRARLPAPASLPS